jgi:cytochrome c
MRIGPTVAVALALTFAAAGAARAAEGDPAEGKKVFAKCAICHSTEAGKNMIGPSLHGVVGRKSASEEGFAYSPAMKAANKTWDEATLDNYLTDPRAAVPGTKMIFPGLKSETDRKNVIAFLATQK